MIFLGFVFALEEVYVGWLNVIDCIPPEVDEGSY